MTPAPGPTNAGRRLDREILGLAIPAFATLIAEPLLVLVDTLVIAHLGASQLGGLTLASSVLGIVVGLSVFLAYGTTATVSRRLGAGDRAGALAGGLDGLVLGIILGALAAAVLVPGAPVILGWYGGAPDVTAFGAQYLRIVALGLPAQMLMLASTGVLRGLQDTRTPLRVVVTINLLNIAFNLVLVLGLGFGIEGAAAGTATSQWVGALIMAGLVLRGARREGVGLRPRPAGVLVAARMGGWLVLRNGTLQAALALTTVTAASLGTVALAAHQVVAAAWSLMTYGLDAFAIAAQALVGLRLGAGDRGAARGVLARVLAWGVGFGVVIGIVLALARVPVAGLFGTQTAVQEVAAAALLMLAAAAPIGAIAFQLDGILIGAGDARFLALAGVVTTLVYAPFALAVMATGAGLAWLWGAYTVWLFARGVALGVRTRGTGWMRTGA
ncbi:MAG: MATE family efflux transporter [Propioniciclava sp.]|uniref:MATE family efflux transporter n=1 Tax=Propioniciclava sp. TaxID=2038686 RepID=UPI0039E729A6